MKRIVIIGTFLLLIGLAAGTASAGVVLPPGWPLLPPIVTPDTYGYYSYPYTYGYYSYPYPYYGYWGYPYRYYGYWGPRSWGHGRGYYGYRSHGFRGYGYRDHRGYRR